MSISLTSVSDTHGLRPEDLFFDHETAKGDILIVCGDITQSGTLGETFSFCKDWAEFAKNFKRTFMIPGNHDTCFACEDPVRYEHTISQMKLLMPNLEVFLGGRTTHQGITFGFMPWVLPFGPFKFMCNEDRIGLKLKRLGPVDVLVTHGPSFGTLDRVMSGFHVGSDEQRLYVKRHTPLIHAFGHIHESSGVVQVGDTWCINSGCANFPDSDSWIEHTFKISDSKEVTYGFDSLVIC